MGGEAGEVMNAGNGEEDSDEILLHTDRTYHNPDSKQIKNLEEIHNPSKR
ncbi:MAG: hypothetical protein ACK5HR_03910 [Mycoplasmatales bacterium]